MKFADCTQVGAFKHSRGMLQRDVDELELWAEKKQNEIQFGKKTAS